MPYAESELESLYNAWRRDADEAIEHEVCRCTAALDPARDLIANAEVGAA